MIPWTEHAIEPRPASPPLSNGWMIVFTDLVALMLTFFVLLFSMSNVQIDRWEKMIDILSRTLNPSHARVETPVSTRYNIAALSRKRAINLDYLSAVLEEKVAQDPVLARSQIMRLEDRLLIVFPGDLLFAPGGAVLSGPARQALFVLGGVLRNIGNQIGVNGHTDPNPPQGGAYISNWELSLARAVAVANLLKRVGYTKGIMAYGYADSRFAELPDLPGPERLSLGRRVDIVVFPTVGG